MTARTLNRYSAFYRTLVDGPLGDERHRHRRRRFGKMAKEKLLEEPIAKNVDGEVHDSDVLPESVPYVVDGPV